MIIYGIDSSLTRTGVWDGRIERSFLIDATKLRGPERMLYIWDQIVEHLNLKFLPGDLVVMEGFGMPQGEAINNIGLSWIIRCNLWTLGVSVLMVAPSTLKKFITGSGKAEKDVILKTILTRWGKDFPTSHEGEAFALATVGKYMTNGDVAMTDFQEEIIKRLRSEVQEGDPEAA